MTTQTKLAKACMGGWCAIRDRCANYLADSRHQPAERLCDPGHDGFSLVSDIRISRAQPVAQPEETHEDHIPAVPHDAVD